MTYSFWEIFPDVSRGWAPTLQGLTPEQYRAHARQLRPLIEAMQRAYGKGSAFRVGIGTLCRRARVTVIQQIVRAVAEDLPGVRFHLWGVKLATLQSRLGVPRAAGELR